MQKEAVVRRLVFVKYLLRVADAETRRIEPFCASALLLFHDSVELFLALGAEHHNVGSKRTEFMQYFNLLDQALAPIRIQHRESMRRLNDSRIGLKHHGTMPSRREIVSFAAMVADFMVANAPLVYGFEFSEVSLADAITTESVRLCLHRADQALVAADLENASMAIAEAFARLLITFGIKHRPASGFRESVRAIEQHINSETHGQSRALTQLVAVVDDLFEEVGLIRQGIDTRRLALFRALTPNASITMAGTARFTRLGGKPPASADDLQFCYDFVVDSALQIEEVHAVRAGLNVHRYVDSKFGAL